MRKQILMYIGILFLSFVIVSYTYNNDEKNKLLLEALSQTLQVNHYLSKSIDDNFSEKVYELYLERIDYNKRYLTKSDVDKLNGYEHDLDDEVKLKSYEFFDLSCDIIHNRIDEAKGIYEEILAKPFDFSIDETIEIDSDKTGYADDEAALRDVWRKSLKYQTMVKLSELIDKQERDKEEKKDDFKEKTFEELENEARKDVLKSQNELFKRLAQIEKSDRRNIYLNCITNFYDPHTGYFPPKDKEDFDIQMSGKLEGIGATLQAQNDGYIKVSRIVVGSACWKQGELEVGDLITKVAQGEEEPVDVVNMRLDKAVQLIRGPKGTEVRLTVKKRDGAVKIIPIIRDVVILEETFAKSLILKDEKDKHPVGYVYLPKFYVDFNNPAGKSCSKDVLTEIEKLKKNNVEGMIIDLRNNGGGSLPDVIKIAGYFIEKGPIVQVKSRIGRKHHVLSDTDPRINYKGPVTILVNSFSASASEIFAAALQDYGRGVVLGSTSTFGKGTVQRFINFDDFNHPKLNNVKPLGSLKLTIQKFYRINGGSTQLKGVESDIVLPDNYKYIEIGEKEQENAMPWDEMKQAKYEPWYVKYNIEKLKNKSEKRIAKNETFKLIEENAQRLKQLRDKTEYSLNLEAYRKNKKLRDDESKKYENIMDTSLGLNPYSIAEDMDFINTDTTRVARRNEWIKNVSKDAYIFEAYNVLKDINK